MIKWRRDQKGTRKLMCDSASPLKLRYLDVISYLQYLHNLNGWKNVMEQVFFILSIPALKSVAMFIFQKKNKIVRSF